VALKNLFQAQKDDDEELDPNERKFKPFSLQLFLTGIF
jgi:hypothetical protein